MTSHLVRLYALVLATLVFFLAWAVVAAHPWQQRQAVVDPRLTAIAARRAHLQKEAAYVRRVLARRYATYRVALRRREQAIARARARIAAARAAQAKQAAAAAAAQPAPISSSIPAPAPAPAPAPVAPPPVASVPAVATTRTS